MNERLDRTQELPTEQMPRQRVGSPGFKPGFQPGYASVRERRLNPPTRTDQLIIPPPQRRPKMPLRTRLRNLRIGGGWTIGGLVVLLICWAMWAAESGSTLIAQSGLVLLLILLVAFGLFALSRLVGGIVLEKLLNRTRRSAILSHMAIGLFLTVVGSSMLRQVEWVVNAWNHLYGTR